jgi:ribose transport system permease protein
MRRELVLLSLLFVLCAVTALQNPQFLSSANMQNMSRLIGAYGIFSIGAGLVIATGGIDLAAGSIFALVGVLLSMMLTEWGWPPALAATAAVAIGAGLGAIHGVLIVRARLQPFIVTLCGLLVYRSVARYLTGDSTVGFGNSAGFEWLRDAATGSLAGVPMPFVLMLVVSVVMGVMLHGSVYGRHLLAVGRNEEASRYAGVPTRSVVAGAYVLSGALTAISAILIAFYTNSIAPSSHGNFYELYAIAAAVLGGSSLRGGEGSIAGIIIGTALLQVLRNLVNLLDIPSSLDLAVMGAVILIGAIADQVLRSRK